MEDRKVRLRNGGVFFIGIALSIVGIALSVYAISLVEGAMTQSLPIWVVIILSIAGIFFLIGIIRMIASIFTKKELQLEEMLSGIKKLLEDNSREPKVKPIFNLTINLPNGEIMRNKKAK